MNSYELSRSWFDFCFENPEKITPTHTAFYFFCIEHCNRLGWKEKFGLPMEMTKEALGIKNYRTYSKVFNDVVDFGFIKVVERSKNQYSATIISIAKNTKAHAKADTKALDKAMIKHSQKQVHGIVGIDKHYNKEQLNLLTKNHKEVKEFLQTLNPIVFNFKFSLIELGIEKAIINDWLKVRSKKKATNSETAFNAIVTQIGISKLSANDCIKLAVENSWSGFKAEWIDGVKTISNQKQPNTPVSDFSNVTPDQLKF